MSDGDKGQQSSAQDKLASYWRSKCRGELLPSREDIDPTDLTDLVSWLVFMDVAYEGKTIRLRYRMTGAAVAGLARREVTGRWFHELYNDEQMAYVIGLARSTIESRAPISIETKMLSPGREFIEVSALACPLASNGHDVDAIVLVMKRVTETGAE